MQYVLYISARLCVESAGVNIVSLSCDFGLECFVDADLANKFDLKLYFSIVNCLC